VNVRRATALHAGTLVRDNAWIDAGIAVDESEEIA
jgi:hypothetical protein